MHVLRLVLGGLLAVVAAVPVGVFVHYVAAQYSQYGHFIGFDDTEGWSYTGAFALFALPALLLALGAIRSVLVQNALRARQRLAVGALGGAAACWAIFSLYQPAVFPHGLGLIWPLLLAMGATGGLVTALLTRRSPNSTPAGR